MRPFDPALLRHLPAARVPVVVLSVLGVLSGLVAVGQALGLAWLISRVATGRDLDAPVLAVVAILTARGLLAALTEYAGAWAAQRVSAQVRTRVLRRWLGAPAEDRPTVTLALTRAADGTEAIEPYVAKYLPSLIGAVVLPVLTLVVLAVVDIWSAVIVVLTVPLLPYFAALIGRHTQEETARRWGAMATLSGHFLDVVRGLPTLVAYGRARFQVDQVRRVGRRHQRATAQTLRTAFMSTLALELLATISVALVAVGVGLRLAEGWIPLFAGLAAILLAPEAYWPIRRVGAEFHNAADGQQALADLRHDLAPPKDVRGPDAAPGTEGEVGLSGVQYGYPGRGALLTDVSVSTPAAPGLTALTGTSGAGKTTILDLLAGLRRPSHGWALTPTRVHYATQRPLLIDGTVAQNMSLAAPHAGDEQIWRALDEVGLGAALRERQGLHTMLGDDGFGLSAGQRARLALARAALADADLILLDEPTAHIATGDRARIHDVIIALSGRRRVIVATHDQALAGRAGDRWTVPGTRPPVEQEASAPPSVTDLPSATAPAGAAEALSATGAAGPAAATGSTAPPRPRDDDHPAPETTSWWRTPRGRLVLASILGGLSAACGVALTATSGWLIVRAWQQPVILTLLVAIVGVRAFGIGRPVLRYAERVLSHDVVLADLVRRRTSTYRRLIPLTPARLGRRSRADLLTAVVADLDDVVNTTSRVTVPLAGAAIASGVAVAILALLLPGAALVLSVATAVVGGVGLLVRRLELPAHRREVAARAAVRRIVTVLTTRMDAARAVLTDGPGPLLTPMHRAQRDQARAVQRSATIRAVAVLLSWLVVGVSILVVASLAAGAYSAGDLTAPVAALVALTPIALADVWNTIPESFGQAARAAAARTRLAAVLDQRPAVTDPVRSAGPLRPGTGDQVPAAPATDLPPAAARSHSPSAGTEVHLEAITARWAEAGSVDLQPLDLHLRPGQHRVLTGPNGAGKSTALAVLARHLDPVSGHYRLDDRSVFEMSLDRARGQVAIVDDEPHIFTGTVRANLALARPQATDAQMIAAVRAAGLHRWLDGLEGGLDTDLQGLSGGERTRLALARALLSERPVLLLDEPTAHLDAPTADAVLHTITTQCADRTVVMVSHEHTWRLDRQHWHLQEIHPLPDRVGAGQMMPCASMASASGRNPATFAPAT